MSIQSNNSVKSLEFEIKKIIKSGGVLFIVMTFIFNLFSLALPLYSLQIFDRVLSSKSTETLIMLLILIIICIITMTAMDALRRKLTATIINNILNIISEADFIENTKTKNSNAPALKLFNLLKEFSGKLNQPTIYAIFDVLFSPLFLIITFFIHPVFFGFLLLINASLLSISLVKSNNLKRFNTNLKSKIDNNHQAEKQCSQNFQNENNLAYVQENYGDYINNTIRSAKFELLKSNKINQFSSSFVLIKNLALVGIPTIGAVLLINNQITIGQFLFASIISMKSVLSFELVGQQLNYLHNLNDSYKKINNYFKTIKYSPKGSVASNSIKTITLLEHSEFKNTCEIRFHKNNSFGLVCDNFKDGINFLDQIGGKNTDQEKVLWDQLSPRIYASTTYKQLIGYCDSQHTVYKSTIADIICPSGIDQFRANECIDLLDLNDEIREFKDKLNHVLCENDKLDPDFIQRLFIARAIYHDPDLIIFNRVDLFLNQKGLSVFINLINTLLKEDKLIFILSDRRSIISKMNNVILIKEKEIKFVGKNAQENM